MTDQNNDFANGMKSQSNAEKIFDAVVELAEPERQHVLDAMAGKDAELKSYVLELLQFSEETGEDFILERPIFASESNKFLKAPTPNQESIGDVIGRYQLLDRLGEGGMGIVYLAEQLTDIRRRVALKIIKVGRDTHSAAAGFENECQAMASLNHPGIAKVLDAGTTTSNCPYMVMELVQGKDIVSFVKAANLGLEQRLRLFVQVCDAVQHAHQKGIIHRDLKPSNILVSNSDEAFTVKVIDFGISKALNQSDGPNPINTLLGGLTGTPLYMSPEQARWGKKDVDTRADVFSLGVILYELLTETTPLHRKQIDALDPIELMEKVRDQDFECPSLRIRKRIENGEIPSKEFTSRGARYRIQDGLDWVVMKCLETIPSKRYVSSAALAADVLRFLDCRPVEAAPQSLSYRCKTFVRKYKWRASLTLAATVGLVAAAVCCIVFGIVAMNANASKDQAMEDLQKKIDQLADARLEIQQTSKERRFSLAVQNAVSLTMFELMKNSPMDIAAIGGPVQVLEITLTGYEHARLIQEDLDPIYRIVEELKQQETRLFDQAQMMDESGMFAQALEMGFPGPLPGGFPGGPPPMPTKRTNLASLRILFLNNLLAECQKEFGRGQELVSVLNMLGASLIEVENYQKASKHLEDAVAIVASAKQNQRSSILLGIAKARKE